MAEVNTLEGLQKLNDQRVVDAGISDVLEYAPVLKKMAAVPASNGTNHRYLVQETGAGSSFRAANTGASNTASKDKQVDVVCEILDAGFGADIAIANAYNGGKEAYLDRELARSVKSANFKNEKQVICGTDTSIGGSANGFEGLLYEDTNTGPVTYVDAGGTSGASSTRAYVIRTAEDGVAVVAGNDGSFDVAEEPVTVAISDTNGVYDMYRVPAVGHYALQKGGKHDVVCIKNITDTAPLTDELAAKALKEFAPERPANLIITGKDGLEMLRASRTATNATGAPAPTPEKVFDADIVASSAVGQGAAWHIA